MLYGFFGRFRLSQSTLASTVLCSLLGYFVYPVQAQQASEPAITAPLPSSTGEAPAISAPLSTTPDDTPEQALTGSKQAQPSHAFQQALLAYTNGLAAFDKEDYATAIKAFSFAITQKPDDPQFHYMAAKAYEGAGDFRGEWFHLRKAVRLQVNHKEAVPLFLRMWQTALDKNILNVGSPLATVKAALGEPDAKQTQNSTLWQYGFMGVEFIEDRVVGVMDLRGSGTLAEPQEEVELDLGDSSKEWELKQRSASRGEYKLMYAPVAKTDSAEVVTHQRLIGLGTHMTVSELMEKMQASLQYEFPDAHWQVLESTDKDVLFEWWLDGENMPNQYEVVRLMAGQEDIHRLAYTSRSILANDTAAREQWINRLRGAKLVPLTN